MFTYQQNKSAECQPCVAQTFKALTQSPETARKIDEHRRLKACGRLAEAKNMKDSLPGCLYQTKEVLVSKGEKKYNKDRMGRWRLQSQCVLNGLVMCDFDHVENPRERFYEVVKKLSSEVDNPNYYCPLKLLRFAYTHIHASEVEKFRTDFL